MITKGRPFAYYKTVSYFGDLPGQASTTCPAQLPDNDRELMRLMDEIHLEEPYLGTRGMKNVLRRRGHKVGRIHVRTLMRKMGIEAIYKKPRLSEPHPDHTIYPYLLRGLDHY